MNVLFIILCIVKHSLFNNLDKYIPNANEFQYIPLYLYVVIELKGNYKLARIVWVVLHMMLIAENGDAVSGVLMCQ